MVRDHRPRVMAGLIRALRDFDVAEDALQDALAAALVQWPRDGVPSSPRAWLLKTAHHKAIDELRRRQRHKEKNAELGTTGLEVADSIRETGEETIRDDMLRLMFTCCHPALSLHAQVALTLRTIAGLTVEEIARAFLVPVPTMAQRLVRAKNKIRAARIPYRVPASHEIEARVEGILTVVYLVFNEGYTATTGEQLMRAELCRHAIWLGRELGELFPQRGDVAGLLALMLLQDSRREARVGPGGELVRLEEQDRTQWDTPQIQEGCALTRDALRFAPRSSYALQAAIAALHAEAIAPEDTDWPQIVALYGELWKLNPTPVVALNRAAAVAMAEGPAAGLELMAELEEPLGQYFLFHSARADLHRRSGNTAAARVAYARAIELCDNERERSFLETQLGTLREGNR